MKRILFSIILLPLITLLLPAQNRLLSMEDVVLNARTTLAPERLADLQWIKGEESFSYIDSLQTLRRENAVTREPFPPLTLASLNLKLLALKTDSLKRFPSVVWENKYAFTFNMKNTLFRFDFKTESLAVLAVRTFPIDAQHMDESPVSGLVAFTVENNLFVLKEGKTIQVTNDTDIDIVNGKSVHREEFGIHKGTFWSSSANYLAFYRMDQTMVDGYPLLDIGKRPGKAEMIRYPMAGEKSHEVTVGVYDLKSGKTIFLQTGLPAEQYLTNITWSPDEKHIYVAIVNRDQNEMKFNRYHAATGAFEKTLFIEKDDRYVQPLHTMEFVKGSPGLFIWQSRRDGFNHLYLYDTTGTLIRKLTTGSWEVTDFNGFDEKGNTAYFTCAAIDPLNRDLYSTSLKTGTMTRMTTGKGTHAAIMCGSGRYFIDQFSGNTTPRTISVYHSSGRVVRELLQAKNPLSGFQLGQTRLLNLKSKDGNLLYARMILPVDFDSTKKYPVIYYLYGGPNVQLITNTWLYGADLWLHYMAQRGYLIFTLDNRGSANRGKSFEQAIFRNLGATELEDHQQGIQWLKSLPYVDENRMGIYGWSYGGFLTTSMMTRNPGVFRAGVAGGPVIDWSYYEVMYTERYMDTPQQNKDGYQESNLLNHAEKLKGKLLLIHGTSDPVVVWQHSLMFIKKCVDKEIPVDYFVYPGHEHNVRGKDRIHLLNKITGYFQSNL